jgi:hypothetical protein
MTTTVTVRETDKMMFILNNTGTTEAISNGVWSSILQHYFPQPKFIIAPEQKNGSSGRPDLTVFYVKGNVPNTVLESVFTLEGKTPNVTIKESDIEQAGNYLAGRKASKELGGRRFGMLVAGEQVVLMVNNGGVKDQTTQWTRDDARIDKYDAVTEIKIWTIQHHADKVDGFLDDFAKKFA